MILQALTEYYEALSKVGEIEAPGWGTVKVSYALCINDSGELEQVVCLKSESTKGKRTVLIPQKKKLPATDKHDNSGTDAHFLCDNAKFLLGLDPTATEEKNQKRFNASKNLHMNILADIDTPAAKALIAFFQTWDVANACNHPLLADYMEDIVKGANLIFRYNFSYIHQEQEIKKAWDRYYNRKIDGPEMICLVTGEIGPVEATHPVIKNVVGAQTTGASLVSFNAPAFCSYGKDQDFNAPVGQYAAFAYTTALNNLLDDWEHVRRLEDTTIIFWAESGEDIYKDIANIIIFDQPTVYDADDLMDLTVKLCHGQQVTFADERLDPNMKFYILGLSPNAARLSVRFFLQNTFGNFLKNVQNHHERMKIVHPNFDKFETLSLRKMLDEAVKRKTQNKSPQAQAATPHDGENAVKQKTQNKSQASNLAGETLRSILLDTPYPAQLINSVNIRLHADHEVTRGRAAIIKAYYIKHKTIDVPEEVLTVALNPNCTSIPYTLGRLFSVLEAIQEVANPGINTTIKDRYFNAASATPAHVFPILINLAQKHMTKLQDGLAIFYNKQITDLLGKLDEYYPTHLSIPAQGAFHLGYYHQTQERFTAKKDKGEN